MPNDSASRHGPADEPAYQGFHTYATSEPYDTNGGMDRWPDNWAGPGDPPSEDPIDDDEPPAKRNYWLPLLWTTGWYAVPALVLVIRTLVLPPQSQQTRADALADLLSHSPLWALALVSGLILALILRWASETWRAVTIGFCAAVVSGGGVTVLYQIW
jgi:hypothetical protein